MRNSLWNDFRMHVLDSNNVLNKLVALNVFVFLVFGLVWLIIKVILPDSFFFMNIEGWFSFPSSPLKLLVRPWTFITYQFMHAGIWHILYNMLILMMAGRIFRDFLGDQKLLVVYLMGGMAGALLFFAAYNILPLYSAATSTLVGASASILAVLVAAATLVPNYQVRLILIGNVKLVYIALFFFVLSFLSLGGSNAGGNFAHIGGAILGFAYIRLLQNGTDIGKWLTNIIDRINGNHKKSSNVRLHYSNENTHKVSSNKVSQDAVDAVLDKIAHSGYDSLSQSDKDILFKASKENL